MKQITWRLSDALPSPPPIRISQVCQSVDNCASTDISNCTFSSHWDGRVSFAQMISSGDSRSIGTHSNPNGCKKNTNSLSENMQRDLLYLNRDSVDRHFRGSFGVCDTLWFDNDVIKSGNGKCSGGRRPRFGYCPQTSREGLPMSRCEERASPY